MSVMLRRRVVVGVCLVGCAMPLAMTGSVSAASKAKAKAPAVTTAVTAKGKVATFAKSVLVLTTGKQFKLDPVKTKVMTSRGKATPAGWSMALCPGDDVVVTRDPKGNVSVNVAPPARMPSGEYVFMAPTKYTYTDPKTQDSKDIPLLWLRSTKGVRYVVELVDDTELTGEGVAGETKGGQAILDGLQKGSTVRITVLNALPTVDKYGDPETAVRVNGVAKQIQVVQLPADGS